MDIGNVRFLLLSTRSTRAIIVFFLAYNYFLFCRPYPSSLPSLCYGYLLSFWALLFSSNHCRQFPPSPILTLTHVCY